MTQLRAVLLAPPGTQPKLLRWHHVWLAFALTGLGFCVGVLTLMLAATAYLKLDSTDLFLSYFLLEPMLLLLNVLPPILLIWFFYFLTRGAEGKRRTGDPGSGRPHTATPARSGPTDSVPRSPTPQ